MMQGSLAPVRQCAGGEGDRCTRRKKGKDDGEGGDFCWLTTEGKVGLSREDRGRERERER
jgi:hypothetical protein